MAPFAPHQSEKAKIEQIVSEFFGKSLHIILEARFPGLLSSGDVYHEDPMQHLMGLPSMGRATTNRWFNLETESSNHLQESVDMWRRGICQEPMVVDVLLQQPTGANSPQRVANLRGESWNDGNDGESFSTGDISRTLLERWVVHYERTKKPAGGSGGLGFAAASGEQMPLEGGATLDEGVSSLNKQQGIGPPLVFPPSHVLERPVVYKRTVIMLRSLYCLVRTLPAFRLFKLSSSSPHSRSFSLSYTISSAPMTLSEQDEGAMMTCSLTPIETQWGKLCISAMYRNATAVTALEITPRILSRIIADYVGSPSTDPLRRFPSVGSLPSGGFSGRRGVHVVPLPGPVPSSLSSGFGRRHSWSGGIHKVPLQPPLAPISPRYRSSSPSPSHPSPDSQPSPPKTLLFHHPSSPSGTHAPYLSPRNSPLQRQFYQPALNRQTQKDSQPIPIHSRRSPSFSPSPSPSPPQHAYSQQERCSSAPVNIPRPTNFNRPLGSSRAANEAHHHSRSPLPPPSPQTRPLEVLPRALSFNSRLQLGSGGHTTNLSPDSKIAPRSPKSTLMESSLLMSPPHGFRTHQINVGDQSEDMLPPGLKKSLYSPRRLSVGGFRAASKTGSLSRENPEDFACPFAIDDEEVEVFHTRGESPGAKPKASDLFDLQGTTLGSQTRFQDAAVGALVRILKSAPPLRQLSAPPGVFLDLPMSRMAPGSSPSGGTGIFRSSPPKPVSFGEQNGSSRGESDNCQPTVSGTSARAGSSFSTLGEVSSPPSIGVRQASSKTAADALEELRGYREMRDFLVRQSGENSR